jgi:exonuclease VII large subunit
MKKTMLMLAISAAAILTVTNGCKSNSEKVEDAQTNVQDAKADLKTVLKDSLTDAQKASNEAEWKIFRNESQAKIKNNDVRIKELKSKMKNEKGSSISMSNRKIDSLEVKNNELVARMDNFDRGKSDWETFKLEFNRDLNGVGESLSKFSYKNK